MDDPSVTESPRKRMRLQDDSTRDGLSLEQESKGSAGPCSNVVQMVAIQMSKESEAGILQFVNSGSTAFQGFLKTRYSDFIVNEISPAGEVYHLDNLAVPRLTHMRDVEPHSSSTNDTTAKQTQAEPVKTSSTAQTGDEPSDARIKAWKDLAETDTPFVLPSEKRTEIEAILGPEVTDQMLELFNKVLNSPHRSHGQYGNVRSSQPVGDRQARTRLHALIREVFRDRLETYTENDSTFVIQAKALGRNNRGQATGGHGDSAKSTGRGAQRGSMIARKEQFEALGGDYLHFSLYKENKDTMEVVSFVASRLKLAMKHFQFAGTKDKRAITVQRVSVHRVFPSQVEGLNRQLRNARIGNFKYEKHGLMLGNLAGNEFVITLRQCTFPGIDPESDDAVPRATAVVEEAMRNLVQHGFINYFGLQRFGTFSLRTDVVGVRLLQGDYEGAVNAILHVDREILEAADNPDDTTHSKDDKARAKAIDEWRRTGTMSKKYFIPRRFGGELALMQHLQGQQNRNFLNAVQTISRNLRHMYTHAYQSLIWNLAASHRWKEGGANLIPGDLVLVDEHKDEVMIDVQDGVELDQDGDPVVKPAAEDRTITEQERFERARPLSQADINSGKYGIFDVVLPLPGFDVEYPYHMKQFYQETMGKEEYGGLDPFNMRRDVKDLSLSGGYRKLLARPGEKHDFKVVKYTDDFEQFVQSDGDRLNAKAKARNQGRKNTHSYGLDGSAESKPLTDAQTTEVGEQHEEASLQNATESQAIPQDSVDTPSDVQSTQIDPKPKLGVVLSFQLGASTYATMVLREVSHGGIVAYKAEIGPAK